MLILNLTSTVAPKTSFSANSLLSIERSTFLHGPCAKLFFFKYCIGRKIEEKYSRPTAGVQGCVGRVLGKHEGVARRIVSERYISMGSTIIRKLR